MASLVRIIDAHGRATPDATACVIGEASLTYGELREGMERFAGAMRRLGLKPGDRVSIYLPNCIEYPVVFYGAMRAGLIANPINSAFTPSEVEYLIRDCSAACLVSTSELLHGLAEVLGRLGPIRVVSADGGDGHLSLRELLQGPGEEGPFPEDNLPACLPYSSGTTGHPKGIVHSHRSLTAQAILSADQLMLRRHDVVVEGLPLVHLYPGNIIMGGVMVAGATLVVQPRFDPLAMVALLARHRATAVAGVPTTFAMLCQVPEEVLHQHPCPSLEIAFSAGAPLPSRLRSEFARLYGVRVLDCYGITEAAGNLTASLRYGDTPDLSCGVPYPLTDVRIVDDEDRDVPEGEVGELIARGPQIMEEYWNRPEDTAVTLRNGYLHTGDLARRDKDGFYFIVDRKKDMIITGGYNVYPAEVENVIQMHPDVAMCAVFGVPDEIKGEKPWAAVVPKAGANVTEEELDRHCRTYLAAYKVPRRFLLVDELPRSSVGKILRRELRQKYGPGMAVGA